MSSNYRCILQAVHIKPWTTFILGNIRYDHRRLLEEYKMPAPLQTHPRVSPCANTSAFCTEVRNVVLPRIQDALTASFEGLKDSCWTGSEEYMNMVGLYHSTLAYMASASDNKSVFISGSNGIQTQTQSPHLPALIMTELSIRWRTAMASGTEHEKTSYRLGLATFYNRMDKVPAKYGCLITERECVVVRIVKTDIYSPDVMEVSEGIAWGVTGMELYPKLTVGIALWYLGMLAAESDLEEGEGGGVSGDR
ncbi:uncharacterized protein BDV14DRAFT_196354 [Aspergillus stella-maris]|uniref:uncharacterized protein n=1 Tax=Aspergillus stella-maris TaxID=1810926 RepID=UPI003CCD3B9E